MVYFQNPLAIDYVLPVIIKYSECPILTAGDVRVGQVGKRTE